MDRSEHAPVQRSSATCRWNSRTVWAASVRPATPQPANSTTKIDARAVRLLLRRRTRGPMPRRAQPPAPSRSAAPEPPITTPWGPAPPGARLPDHHRSSHRRLERTTTLYRDEAFARLRRRSHSSQTKLRDVAADLIAHVTASGTPCRGQFLVTAGAQPGTVAFPSTYAVLQIPQRRWSRQESLTVDDRAAGWWPAPPRRRGPDRAGGSGCVAMSTT